MSTLRIGPPLDKAIDIGAIVARVQLERIERMVAQGIAEGATCWQPKTALPTRGFFYPPTLLSNVHPTSIVAQQEIFGPVLAAMTFRTPREAVELANNTVYGLASCVWSENINVALHVAAQIKAGVVWVNCTNMFDAACGFGGYRESGYGREGGREGLLEYLEPAWFKHAPKLAGASTEESSPLLAKDARNGAPAVSDTDDVADASAPAIDRTVKLYIGGKQARPDSGYSMEVRSAEGRLLGEAPLGNRKDIRNAVEAARKAEGVGKSDGAQSRAGSLLLRGESRAAARRDRASTRGGRRREASRGGSRTRHRAHLHLRGVGRQVRRCGAQSAVPQYRDRDERTDRDRRRDLPSGSAAAGLFVARDAAARRGQHGDRGSFRNNIRSLPAISTSFSIPAICRAAR